jgi:hypothetical protein
MAACSPRAAPSRNITAPVAPLTAAGSAVAPLAPTGQFAPVGCIGFPGRGRLLRLSKMHGEVDLVRRQTADRRQRIWAEIGMPKPVIRLSKLRPIFASVR